MKNIRFGVVGTNFITDRIIAAGRLTEGFELAAVCSRTQVRADEYATQHDIPHTFTSLAEMAASPLVDAVYIASPNSCHAEQTILCLEAGKHVLCEKPLASNAREAREMIAAARRTGRVLMEAMKPTLTPNFAVAREYLPRLGTIRRWFASFGKYSSRYDALQEAAAGRGELPNAFNPALSNGAAMDIGVYALYPMVALFGRPREVQAAVVMLPSGVDGHGAVNFVYDGGMLGTVLYSKMVDMGLPWEIEGEEGTLRGNAINSIRQLEFRQRGGEWEDISSPEWTGNDYTYELEEFMGLVRGVESEERGVVSGSSGAPRESAVNSLDVSLASMEVLDSIRAQAGVWYPADE